MEVDTTNNVRVRSTTIAALYALMPYILANMYLTLVVNWPGISIELVKLSLTDMHRIANINFIFCLYSLGALLMLILEKMIGAVVCHIAIIVGFLMGIGIIYTVVVPLRVVVHPYITAAIMIGSVVAIYSMLRFYVRLFKRWKNLAVKAYQESRVHTDHGDL